MSTATIGVEVSKCSGPKFMVFTWSQAFPTFLLYLSSSFFNNARNGCMAFALIIVWKYFWKTNSHTENYWYCFYTSCSIFSAFFTKFVQQLYLILSSINITLLIINIILCCILYFPRKAILVRFKVFPSIYLLFPTFSSTAKYPFGQSSKEEFLLNSFLTCSCKRPNWQQKLMRTSLPWTLSANLLIDIAATKVNFEFHCKIHFHNNLDDN